MKLATVILLILSSASLGETVHTQQDGIAVDVTLEPTTFKVGDSVSLTIKAIAPNNMKLIVPNTSFDYFFITDQSSMLDIPTEGGREWNWQFQLDTFDASVQQFQSLTVEWTDEYGNSGTLIIDDIPVTITSAVGDTLNQLPLRDIVESKKASTQIAYWLLAIVSFVFIGGIVSIIYFVKHNKTQTISPEEKAKCAIELLRNSDVEAHEFYTRLSNIVRTYLEDQFNISAPGYTTREFLISEKKNPRLEHSDRTKLAAFLVAADLVKYARFEPSKNNWDVASCKALEFVTSTEPSKLNAESEVAA